MAKLDFDDIINNVSARTIIAIPKSGGVAQIPRSSELGSIASSSRPVVGFLQDDITISGSNEFNNPLQNSAQNSLDNALQIGQSIGGRLFGDKLNLRQFSIKTVDQSALFYTGSAAPVFNLSFAFIALRETDDVRKMVERLYECVLPTFGGAGLTKNIRSPLGFIPRGLEARGTIALQVGKWLRATRLVMTSVDFKFSKETIESGAPLYAEGSVSMRPFRMISFQEFRSIIGVT